jgi:TPR repeat protein
VKWYRKAAENGDAEAQNNLGCAYARGEGVERNYEEAVKWCRKAAEQGDATAQNNLGLAYTHGEGVEQDHDEAVKWFRKATENGYAGAQYSLEAPADELAPAELQLALDGYAVLPVHRLPHVGGVYSAVHALAPCSPLRLYLGLGFGPGFSLPVRGQ